MHRQHEFKTDKIKEELESIDKTMNEHLNIQFIKSISDSLVKLGIDTCNDKRQAMKDDNFDELYNKNKELIEEEKQSLELSRINIDLIIQNKKIATEISKLLELKEQRKKADKVKTISVEDYKKKYLKNEVYVLNNAKILMALEDYINSAKKAKRCARDGSEDQDADFDLGMIGFCRSCKFDF